MSGLSIINSVFVKLINDPTFLSQLGLTVDSEMRDKVKKIQQEMVPDGLTVTNIPLCCIYPIPGIRSKSNSMIYDAMFEMAIYSDNSSGAKSSTTKAGTMRIGERAREILHQVQLAGATFKVEFQTDFQAATDTAGIKKYVMRFKVSEEL